MPKGEVVPRKPRGKTPFTKTGLGHLIDVATQRGLKQLTMEFPGGGKVILPLSKADGTPDKAGHNEWDQDLYDKDKAPVHK
jgi:hypothetical protein